MPELVSAQSVSPDCIFKLQDGFGSTICMCKYMPIYLHVCIKYVVK